MGVAASSFRGRADGDTVQGELTMAGATRPLTAERTATAASDARPERVGIKPYRGLMGALKVRDDVEVIVAWPMTRRSPTGSARSSTARRG